MNLASHILVGTAKGLLVYHYLNNKIQGEPSLHFKGFSVNMLFVDETTGRWWTGISHRHWGQKLHFSDNQGESWNEVTVPSFEGRLMPDGSKAKLRQIWCMERVGNELWMGTDPGGLFRSNDEGLSWSLVDGLWNHPSRQIKEQWFGAGSDFPFIHSIVVEPGNPDHVYVAVSCAGVFETKDGGEVWVPKNDGLIAAYLPNPDAEVGHDPHCLLMPDSATDVLWQQNHCGVFYSTNAGKNWIDVSRKDSIPYYGFALAVDDEDPSSAWVIPVESDESRIAPDLKLRVYRTIDWGKNWESDSDGLPDNEAFDIVLRQSFCRKKGLMVFGTTNGNLYFKEYSRKSWELISGNLTKVNSVLCV